MPWILTAKNISSPHLGGIIVSQQRNAESQRKRYIFMKRKKLLISLMALLLLAAVPAFSLAVGNYGAANVAPGQTYTLEQMLTYAIQDEYLAQAEYDSTLNTYKIDAPFSNSLKAESTHITMLSKLFDNYGIAVPENTAEALVTVPGSLEEAYEAGIRTETANIAMYDNFLAQTDLPEDVRSVFATLKNASENHLNAYTRNDGISAIGLNNRGGCFGNSTAQCSMTNAQCPAAQTNGQCPMASRSTVNGQCPMYGQNSFRGHMGMGGRGGNAGICNRTSAVNPQN
jgi:hypothetical protein